MPKRVFDKKFGESLLETIPLTPGVYLFWNEEGGLLYVGKAKNLRRRLGEYRRSVRGEKGYKLVHAAASLTWELCESDLDASLKEVGLIQSKKPKKNIASAYSFLYPYVGLRYDDRNTAWICYSTKPETLPDYTFFGAFRSRGDTLEFFASLRSVLKYLGHEEKGRHKFPSYSFGHGFRRLPENVVTELHAFLKGESEQFLATVFERLLNHAAARARAAEVKEDLRVLRQFFRAEAGPLAEALKSTGYQQYPVPQTERDPLFLRARFRVTVATGVVAEAPSGPSESPPTPEKPLSPEPEEA